MYLREIGVHLPYLSNDEYFNYLMSTQNVTEQEARRLDYLTNWKEKNVMFVDQTRCIAALYSNLLGKFKTEKTNKILIMCVTDVDKVNVEPKTKLGITEVYVLIDLESYWKLSNIEKKKVILEKIHEGVLQVANHFSWEISIFNQVYKEIIDRDYVNEYTVRQKASPDRKHKAELFCQHDIDFVKISMIIRIRKTNDIIKSELLIKDRPNEFIFVPKLGEIKWISNSEITLTHSYKANKKWMVKLDE